MNPDAFRHKILSLARLPIPTPPLDAQLTLGDNSKRSRRKLTKVNQKITHKMVNDFLSSRRQGLSPHTVVFYHRCFTRAIGVELTPQGINDFLTSLTCHNGKHSYFRVIRVLCNWLTRNDLILSNPVKKVDPPKIQQRILPSFTESEMISLISKINNPRDKETAPLFADSGLG